ncbi:hypothetical protein ACFVZM_22730 [Streptomyces sioyaensis]|uniref:hypothetical protein n=1 Tax=Streptomyces sioyaensis TaxID=67364 RepID=UPI0036C8D834
MVGLLSSQQAWGPAAAVGHGCAAVMALRSSTAWARTPALIAVTGALTAPLSAAPRPP